MSVYIFTLIIRTPQFLIREKEKAKSVLYIRGTYTSYKQTLQARR